MHKNREITKKESGYQGRIRKGKKDGIKRKGEEKKWDTCWKRDGKDKRLEKKTKCKFQRGRERIEDFLW